MYIADPHLQKFENAIAHLHHDAEHHENHCIKHLHGIHTNTHINNRHQNTTQARHISLQTHSKDVLIEAQNTNLQAGGAALRISREGRQVPEPHGEKSL